MTTAEREALKIELRAELMDELTKRKPVVNPGRDLIAEFEADYQKFDRGVHNAPDKARAAVSALIKLRYGCDYVARIPIEKIDEARTVIRGILDAALLNVTEGEIIAAVTAARED